MKKILCILTVISIWFSLWPWFICTKFEDAKYFSAFDLQLRLIEAIHGDSDTPLLWVRVFHNKVVGTLLDVYRSFTTYYDLQFLISLIGIIGVVAMFFGVYDILTKHSFLLKIVSIGLLIIFPLISILLRSVVPYTLWIVGFGVMASLFAWYGIWRLNMSKRIMLLWILLLLLTIWWNSIYSPLILKFCLQ